MDAGAGYASVARPDDGRPRGAKRAPVAGAGWPLPALGPAAASPASAAGIGQRSRCRDPLGGRAAVVVLVVVAAVAGAVAGAT
jgi:hypothetical protein